MIDTMIGRCLVRLAKTCAEGFEVIDIQRSEWRLYFVTTGVPAEHREELARRILERLPPWIPVSEVRVVEPS